jgi:quercetin dioxygenase-like cupin family protein
VKRLRQVFSAAALLAAAVPVAVIGQTAGDPPRQNGPQAAGNRMAGMSDFGIYAPDQIAWKDGPPSLPAGARFAVLEGDPAKAGFFTMRLRLPDGYRIPPHWHPKVEHVTVISGALNLGMGRTFDQKATRELPAGTFGYWPAGMRHFAWARGETVLQLHGFGPWRVIYVNPADDPRNASR